jgi:iron complex transport system ATP-binding protein
MIIVNNLTYSIKKKVILQGVSLEINPAEHTVILGPNGAGKSTFLRLLAGGVHASSGEVRYSNFSGATSHELAQQRAFLSQHYEVGAELTVEQLVKMGRYPYYHKNPHVEDVQIVEFTLKKFDLNSFRLRKINSLSGGELQRVQVARVYAQLFSNTEITSLKNKFLFLDEPVNNLDLKHQQELINLSQELTQNGVGVVSVLHDINMALNTANRLIFIKNGKLIADMNDKKMVSCELLEEIYEIPFLKLGEEHFFPVNHIKQ